MWTNTLKAFCLFAFTCAACQVNTDARRGQPYVPHVTNQIVADTSWVLKDGEGRSLKLEEGNYEVQMTASDDGASVEWVGGNCAKTQQMTQLTTTCRLPGTGQLIVRNPTTFGLGKDVSVTVKVTKLAQ